MVGVEVRDHDRIDIDVVEVHAQLAEYAIAAVDEQVGVAFGHQIAAAGTVDILPRR